jgi:endonuclease-8
VPEGDTIHRIARRIDAALVGRRLERAAAANPRSPLHGRGTDLAGLQGREVERARARGKHLLIEVEGGAVIHSHLGMGGRWFVSADGRLPHGRPWLLLASGPAVASCTGGKILRLTSASRARNDPALLQLGPDPLAPDFDEKAAASRLAGWEPSEAVGSALLDQRLVAGIGNVIRIEALHLAAVSPWRSVGELRADEASALVRHVRWIMDTALREGARPKRIYGSLARRPCPRCGGRIERRGQGDDDNRITYWCPGCQT